MEKVGTARAHKEILGRYEALPLVSLTGKPAMGLDSYVTKKSLDGLFKMLGEKEKKIRSNTAARTTDLLKQVFGASR